MNKATKSIIDAHLAIIFSMMESLGRLDLNNKEDHITFKQLYTGIGNNLIEAKKELEEI